MDERQVAELLNFLREIAVQLMRIQETLERIAERA
jgi:hypothetical protein